MISARQLEVLCTVIEVGTTAGAAEVLTVSQPAVSNMIRHMETLIGFPLFVRERGRLEPTQEALHIAQEAQHLFVQHKRVDAVIRELRGGTIGRLNLVATPSIGYGILPRVLAEFLRDRPKLKVSVELGSVDEIVARLISGQAELGLSITRPRHPALTVRPVAEGRLMCVSPVDHEVTLSPRVRVTDLNHVRHISYAPGTPLGQTVDRVFSDAGLERRYFFEVRHTSTALEMAAAGLGVALVDNFALIGRARADIAIRPTEPKLPITVHAVTSNLFPTTNIALKFQTFFTEFVAQHSAEFDANV
ncbi:LysR substrate-binding domain-containing protein [Acidimangrovimonas sediminis]|uniref:LysR substrate-binding domain-containing protein n=1 Tax=Acidimangrovimonas sediminis TaxID=2056283 RepID=UPI001E6144F0|nr:LysR substrate-binding domain-containing protein [Acidimangrovimonas sediminis]